MKHNRNPLADTIDAARLSAARLFRPMYVYATDAGYAIMQTSPDAAIPYTIVYPDGTAGRIDPLAALADTEPTFATQPRLI